MLEQELGRALFDGQAGLRVTPYGETVREYAHNILNHEVLLTRWQKIRRNGNLPFLPTQQHDCEASQQIL